jgi:hypothetical protein
VLLVCHIGQKKFVSGLKNFVTRKENNIMIKKIWNWHIDIIRKYPIWCAYAAWCEGLIIGILVVMLWL